MCFFRLRSANKFGCVSGGKENPDTYAPHSTSVCASHAPLKPVCPVTSTFFPLKKSLVVMCFCASRLPMAFLVATIVQVPPLPGTYPYTSKTHHVDTRKVRAVESKY